MQKYIWLFGENNGKTANNNSFYYWKHVVNRKDEIEKYFVVEKTKKNTEIIDKLTPEEKKYVIWKDSLKHYNYYKSADMLFVSLSFQDVQPSKFSSQLNAPVIYLQHGTLGMKKLGYTGSSYTNHMFRFYIYNKSIIEQFSKENDFRMYQLFYAKYHPRYQALVSRQRAYQQEMNQIMWFVTWREYFGTNHETNHFLRQIKRTLENQLLNQYLNENHLSIKLCLHSLFTEEHKKYLKDNLKDVNVQIVDASKIDVMDEMVKSKLLITDYSSLGFDFTFLNKPVILFQPDREIYLKNRELYCSFEEIEECSIESVSKLIRCIVQNNYGIHPFFRKRLPEDIDYDYVFEGKHIDRMYENLKEVQLNKIAFIGYNYFGRGGTVSATKSLAEGLLEKGYLVEMLSLKKTSRIKKANFPYGLIVKAIYSSTKKAKKTKIKNFFYSNKKYLSYLNYDSNRDYLIPYTGVGLESYLKSVKAKTVVSTRETIHFFLKDATSEFIKDKIYFFHTDANLIDDIFPGVVSKLNQLQLEKCAFVTELNRQRYIEKLGFDSYDDYAVVGNALTSDNVIEREEIQAPGKKEKYTGIYLTRIAKDRIKDLENAIQFGKYLKEHNIENVRIDVFGTGDYVDQFEEMIFKYELDEYIYYRGLTTTPQLEIRNHDFVIDFSFNQSFGMAYIESILNGSIVYAYPNYGSREVLKEIPYAFIESHEELAKKIQELPELTTKELQNNYDIIMSKYSREVVADKFIELTK